ncbi:MAG: helix-turn-helix domain-containing protein [Dokdonia sp.]|jgi:AraC-like DNA-binding protein
MFFDFTQKSSLLLIFFFNGVVFSYLLFKKHVNKQHQPSKWLGWFVLLSALYICPFMLGYAGWYSKRAYREFLFFVPFQQLFLLGPVIYFYSLSLLDQSFRLKKRDYIHFLPALVYLLYTLIVFVVDKLILDSFYFYADGRDKDLSFWYQMSGLISMLFYLYLSLKKYFLYKNLAFQEVSFAENVLFKWIRNFLIAFSVILVLRVLFFISNPEWGQFGSKFWYYMCFSLLFYYIALSGYFNTIKVPFELDLSLLGTINKVPLNTSTPPQPKAQDHISVDYQTYKAQILKLMKTEQLYKNPSLTLTDIATELDTNRNVISKVINLEFKMNFNDFINSLRLEEVIHKYKEGQQKTNTLLGIALECGFNSKSTFNRAFKKQFRQTPREFIQKMSVK